MLNVKYLIDLNESNSLSLSVNKENLGNAWFIENIINVNSEELLKAACCNLSESFETNPSVDVNHNDAITGTKQIEMLGLKSPYILITEENIPNVTNPICATEELSLIHI